MTELLAGAVPAALETVTVMVYLLPGSSPDIWYPRVKKAPVSEIVPILIAISPSPGQVSLSHLTSNPVTTVPLGTLPVIVMAVDEGDVVPERAAADGTVG